jgi:DNA primase
VSQVAEEILQHIDIIDVISKYVPLKRSGANFSGCCPFHNEKTPSFMVSPSKQIFKCFGCGKGGNAITFVQEIERIDFWDAIKELAKQGNVDISKYQNEKRNDQAYSDGKEKIKRLHTLAQKYFVQQYKDSQLAQNYVMQDRKLAPESIETFGIGYAPDSHYDLLQHLRAK